MHPVTTTEPFDSQADLFLAVKARGDSKKNWEPGFRAFRAFRVLGLRVSKAYVNPKDLAFEEPLFGLRV